MVQNARELLRVVGREKSIPALMPVPNVHFCMRRPILHHTLQGDAVYDPSLGSGSTIIAAEINRPPLLRHRAQPDYCALAIARWEQLVDGKAKLISRGAGAG